MIENNNRGAATDDTIVAVYDTAADADAAVRDLKAANIPADAISRHDGVSQDSTSEAAPREEGFWASLFGGGSDDDSVYERSLSSGSSLVTVRASGPRADEVTEILERHGPVDIDERASAYGVSETRTAAPTALASTGTTSGTTTGGSLAGTGTAATDGDAIQLAEEQLAVGKRAVNRGTTRVRRFVVETPVEESVALRDETVTVERRAVTGDVPVSATDFTEKTFEMTETDEEVVVAKTARVTEEVVLRKEVADRVETVKDTVRRDEVEIERIPGEKVAAVDTAVTTPVTPRAPKI
ncbi:hypothetical protein N825_21420 [Skermanella stibiiresistens SB22]|uniref:DUF2382 domain-containing protein n=1 Tax=Skermanella stibiiresistens SB22 TaxID=1385369 RepID=W9GTF3_9PROT|nr:YsnF/AvaK domain-containing protein [Skermanella stibiiresistens]EWY37150.1 hypothetical protein N825_21420 [Skermanella stibiiresistens SB22]